MQDGKSKAAGTAKAEHGYRNEVSWDGGKGRQPYANRGEVEQSPAREVEGGNAGEAAGRNLDQLQEVKKMPGDPEVRGH